MIDRRWKFAPQNEELSASISTETGIPLLLARCLLARNCQTSAEAKAFLEPRLANLADPFLIPNMERAVERLIRAHASQERFIIFGDYDVDGVTATALLTEFFRELGWNPIYYLPHRLEEGYGLTADAVDNCLRASPVKLVLAVDCGSTACDVVRDLQGRGVEVIVLDHHQVSEPAPALALVNPQLAPGSPPWKELCSAGLAFKLAHAVLKRARQEGWPGASRIDLRKWLDLVALGTVADMVPLRGENRIFAQAGMRALASTPRAGIKALKAVAGLNGEITATHLGFQLGPRLNAAGRLETALDALELLLCSDENRARQLAEALDLQNRERQEIERRTADQAIEALRAKFNPANDYAIVEGEANWHIGVVGIVASRVLREFNRPTIILGSDGSTDWRGSGRSIEGFDLAAALRGCGDLLLKHGGHAMAAGLTLASTNVTLLRERLNTLARGMLTPDALQPVLTIDSEVQLRDLTFPAVNAIEKLEPFGQGNPPVNLVCRGLELRSEIRRLGGDGQHARFTVSDRTASLPVLWWNCPGDLHLPQRFDLAFSPELNEYNGLFGIQLKALDSKPC